MAEKQTPEPDNPGPDYVYRKALAAGRFLIQHCRGCDAFIHYPRLLCPACGCARLDTVEASGGGTVYASSVVRQRPERGGDYNIALIDLDEGPRLMSWVVGLDPADVTIGMKVEARIETVDDKPLLVFRRA